MRKSFVALLIGALALFLPLAAHAQTYNQVNGTAVAGGRIVVNLGPFDPNSTAGGTLFSDPVALGNVKVNAQGIAVFNVAIPSTFSGVHHVEATGVFQGQAVKRSSPNFTVVRNAAAANTGGLSRTGASSTVPMAIAGVAAVLLGTGLVVAAKRRYGSHVATS